MWREVGCVHPCACPCGYARRMRLSAPAESAGEFCCCPLSDGRQDQTRITARLCESYGQSNRSQALALADVLAQVREDFAEQLSAEIEVWRTDVQMGAWDLKQAFRHIPGIDRLTIAHKGNGNQVISIGDRKIEVGPMASNDEIERALTEQSTYQRVFGGPQGNDMSSSVIDRIRAKALKARGVVPEAIKRFEADLDSIIAEESVLAQKQAAAVAPHQEAISGIKGEIEGLKSAIDILTNGEPE